MNEDLQSRHQEISKVESQLNQRKFKFMTNILVRAQDKETYVKMLKKITKDALVPTNRIIYAGVIVLIATAVSLWLLLSDTDRIGYIIIPSLMFFFASVWIAFYVTISSRKKSMFASVVSLLLMQISEKLRLSSTKYGELQTLGIKSFKKGFILFENGDFGACFACMGQLGKSTLPEVANQVHQIRYDYLVARSDTSHEITMTSIKKLNVDKQVDYYKRVHANSQGNTLTDAWRRYMSRVMKDEVEDKIAKSEVSIYQYLIIAEPTQKDLIKSMKILDLATADGMYSSIRQITSAEELIESIGALSLVSLKGAEKYVQEEQARELEKFERQ